MKDRSVPVRVVVVEDSQTVRELLVAILQNAGDIQVVGTASNGEEAVRLVKRLRPNVVTMDINMPRLNGLDATRQIMREAPTPIVVISGSLMRTDVDLAFEAMQAGALTAVRTPGLADPQTCDQVIQTIRLMSDVPVVRRWNSTDTKRAAPSIPSLADVAPLRMADNQKIQVIGIAASTGGPATLATVLRPLPASFTVPILITQHITTGFGAGMAEWLDSQVALRVSLARHGDAIQPGVVLLAPDDYHMQVNAHGLIELSREGQYRGLRPSANFMFNSLARFFGPTAIGIIMTGMGNDGVEGLKNLRQAGGLTIAQDEKSCVVYGMPQEAVLNDAVDRVLTPEQIAITLSQLARPAEKKGEL